MITQSAKEGFDILLMQALRNSMVSSDDACDISILSDSTGIQESRMVVLTVSSYLFRLMVMFYFTPDEQTKAHFARLNHVPRSDMDEQAFLDAIAECGNLCCGILNRDLGRFFPHIGMSTPNVIDRRCAEYLQMLNCGHVQHFEIGIDQAPRFHVTLCVSDYAEIDFSVSEEEAGSSNGELELF